MHAAEENRRRVSKLRPDGVRLQCLRCRSEFKRQGDGSKEKAGPAEGGRQRQAAMLLEGEDGWDEDEERTQQEDDGKGERDFREGLKLLHKNVKKTSCVVLIYFDLCSSFSQLLIFFVTVFYDLFQEH